MPTLRFVDFIVTHLFYHFFIDISRVVKEVNDIL